MPLGQLGHGQGGHGQDRDAARSSSSTRHGSRSEKTSLPPDERAFLALSSGVATLYLHVLYGSCLRLKNAPHLRLYTCLAQSSFISCARVKRTYLEDLQRLTSHPLKVKQWAAQVLPPPPPGVTRAAAAVASCPPCAIFLPSYAHKARRKREKVSNVVPKRDSQLSMHASSEERKYISALKAEVGPCWEKRRSKWSSQLHQNTLFHPFSPFFIRLK